jgi:hypothetical protein
LPFGQSPCESPRSFFSSATDESPCSFCSWSRFKCSFSAHASAPAPAPEQVASAPGKPAGTPAVTPMTNAANGSIITRQSER